MSLANLLSVEQIIPEMKATEERWAAIVELIDLLVNVAKSKRKTAIRFSLR